MDRRDDDMAGHAWPGFVDILSSVIIMFIFFILVIAIIMSILSIERVRDQQLSAAAEAQEEDGLSQQSQQIMDLLQSGEVTVEDISESILNKQRAEDMAAQVASLEKELQQIQIGLSNTRSETNDVVEEERSLTINFGRNAVTLSEDTENIIAEFLGRFPDKSKRVRIISSDNQNASYVSSSRKVNLARSFNVRNSLIENEWPENNISIQFRSPQEIESDANLQGSDWIRVVIQE